MSKTGEPGGSGRAVHLRPTTDKDLDFVLGLESHPENSPFVGSWSAEEHQVAMAAPDRGHWIIESGPGERVGYLIELDLQAQHLGVHIKRVVVGPKGRGIGRQAVAQFTRHALERTNAEFVWLDVLADNERAQAAYRAAGYTVLHLSEPEVVEWAKAVGGFEAGSVLMACRSAPTPDSELE